MSNLAILQVAKVRKAAVLMLTILAARVPTGRLGPPGLSNGPGGAASMVSPSVSDTVRRGLAWRGLTWLIEVRGLANRSEGSGQ